MAYDATTVAEGRPVRKTAREVVGTLALIEPIDIEEEDAAKEFVLTDSHTEFTGQCLDTLCLMDTLVDTASASAEVCLSGCAAAPQAYRLATTAKAPFNTRCFISFWF